MAILGVLYILTAISKEWSEPHELKVTFIWDSKPAIQIRNAPYEEYLDPMKILQNEMDLEYDIIRIDKALTNIETTLNGLKDKKI